MIRQQMQQADAKMETLLTTRDLGAQVPNGTYGYEVVQTMNEHEMHHHGQVINLLVCHHFAIPQSWRDGWALADDA